MVFYNNNIINKKNYYSYSTTRKCDNLGLKTCADLQRMSLSILQQQFGKKMGEILYQNCRGIDNKSLMYDQVSKRQTLNTLTMNEYSNLICFTFEKRLENRLVLKSTTEFDLLKSKNSTCF